MKGENKVKKNISVWVERNNNNRLVMALGRLWPWQQETMNSHTQGIVTKSHSCAPVL